MWPAWCGPESERRMLISQSRLPPIVIAAADHRRLSDLAIAAERAMPDVAEFLNAELDRAAVVSADRLPADVVRMYAAVEFRDEERGETRRVVLVYPGEQDLAAGRISVLTPVGVALLGMKVGQSIGWTTRRGERKHLTVLAVARDAQM